MLNTNDLALITWEIAALWRCDIFRSPILILPTARSSRMVVDVDVKCAVFVQL